MDKSVLIKTQNYCVMKNVKNLIIRLAVNTALVLGVVSFAYAAGDVPSIKITKSGLTKLNLIMDGMSASTEATISIEDEKGYVLLSEEVKRKSSFAKTFNFEKLPVGDYNIIINTQTRVTIQPITLKGNDIEIHTSKRKVVFHPVVRQNGSFLDISWLATRITNVKVSILAPNGSSVFEDNVKNIFKLEKRYNVAQLESGKYTVKVKTPFDSYYQDIVVK